MILIISIIIFVLFPNIGFAICLKCSVLLFIINNLINKTIARASLILKESK